MLRQVPNLRRIAVTPFADVTRCVEQIGQDYVISYRPSPADMVSYGLDDQQVRAILVADLESCRGCHFDITLKDVETVEGDPDRARHWVQLTRGVIDDLYGG
jgi:D-alanyl-D-alanine dipeptidase